MKSLWGRWSAASRYIADWQTTINVRSGSTFPCRHRVSRARVKAAACLFILQFPPQPVSQAQRRVLLSAMPRHPQPPHEDPMVERKRQAHRDRRATKARAKASAGSSVGPSTIDQKLLQLRSELCPDPLSGCSITASKPQKRSFDLNVNLCTI